MHLKRIFCHIGRANKDNFLIYYKDLLVHKTCFIYWMKLNALIYRQRLIAFNIIISFNLHISCFFF